EAYGAVGRTVETTADIGPGVEGAVAANGPALVHVRLDPEALSPSTTLTALRSAALETQGRGTT
ncbi:hypothetical protein KC217_21545, partial [Mycobacterium tuberculosis]|nr:hypothetical protein [Mycobacterium tuberculosis]